MVWLIGKGTERERERQTERCNGAQSEEQHFAS